MQTAQPAVRQSAALKGQTTVELVILVGVAVGALAVMMVYVQRAYQGYLRGNAFTQGQQFDPTQPYTENQRLSLSQDQQIDVVSAQGPVTLPGGSSDLPSIPGGTVPGRLLTMTVDATSDWSLGRDQRHEAR